MLRLRQLNHAFHDAVSELGIAVLEVCTTQEMIDDRPMHDLPLRASTRPKLGPDGTPRILWLTSESPVACDQVLVLNEWDWTLPLAWLRPRRVVVIGLNTTIEVGNDEDDLEHMIDYWPSAAYMTVIYDFTSSPEGHAGRMLAEVRSAGLADNAGEYSAEGDACAHSAFLRYNDAHVHELELAVDGAPDGAIFGRRSDDRSGWRARSHFPGLRKFSLWEYSDVYTHVDFVEKFISMLSYLNASTSFSLHMGHLCVGHLHVTQEACARLFNALPQMEEFGTLLYLRPPFWQALHGPIGLKHLALYYSEPDPSELTAMAEGIAAKMPSLVYLELSLDNMMIWRSEDLVHVLSRLKGCPSLARVALTHFPDRPETPFDPRSLSKALDPIRLEMHAFVGAGADRMMVRDVIEHEVVEE